MLDCGNSFLAPILPCLLLLDKHDREARVSGREGGAVNIQEAAKKAREAGSGIYRASQSEMYNFVIPTNTCSCCIVASMKHDGKHHPRWNPALNDLVADDWEVYGTEATKV